MKIRLQYAVSYLLVLCLAPFAFAILALAAIAIVLIDHYSPFFKQDRIGEDGWAFTAYKLQTRRPKLPHQEYRNPVHDAERDTRLGLWLQEHGIDELMQFINILKGDMTLVGPRALMESNYHDILAKNPGKEQYVGVWAYRRWTRKPAITGWHQIHSSGPGIIRLDNEYLQDTSWGRYFLILWRSLCVVPMGKTWVRRLAAWSPF